MKRLIAIFSVMVLISGIFTGCNSVTGTSKSDSSSTSASTSPNNEKVTITMWVFPLFDGYQDIIQNKFPTAVQKEHHNITLEVEVLSYDSGPEKLTVAMASGSTPDMMEDGLSRLAPAINANLCADLSDVMGNLSDIVVKAFQKEGMKDGKNFYIPRGTSNGYNITLNATLAKELGVYNLLPADKIHWSYEEFLNFCREARKAGEAKGVYPLQLWAGTRSSDAAYYSFLMTGGTNILNDDHTKVAANTSAAETTLAVLKTLIDEKLVPDGAATTKDVDTDANFDSGKLIMRFQSAGAQTNISIYNKSKAGDITGFETEIIQFPSPTGTTDPHVASWGTIGQVVFLNAGDAAKIDASKKAIEVYFNRPDIATVVNLKGGYSPCVNNVVLDYKDETLNAQVAFANEANALYSDSSFGILEPWWSSFRETFYIQLQAYYTGTKTAKQALSDWETAGNEVITKALTSSK